MQISYGISTVATMLLAVAPLCSAFAEVLSFKVTTSCTLQVAGAIGISDIRRGQSELTWSRVSLENSTFQLHGNTNLPFNVTIDGEVVPITIQMKLATPPGLRFISYRKFPLVYVELSALVSPHEFPLGLTAVGNPITSSRSSKQTWIWLQREKKFTVDLVTNRNNGTQYIEAICDLSMG